MWSWTVSIWAPARFIFWWLDPTRSGSWCLRSIGPVWDGNEVWLLAAGGTLYFAFPALYASSFSGFYLPLMMVLWLLILRGISIEFRNHIDSPVWTPLWDAGFGISSALLRFSLERRWGTWFAVCLGPSGDFFLPLWTDFAPGPQPGVLDWYTILIGVLVSGRAGRHGALWVTYKTGRRAECRAPEGSPDALWWLLGILTLAATAASFSLQPQHSLPNFRDYPWGAVFPLLAMAGFAGMRRLGQRTGGVSLLLRLSGGDADQRSLRSLSLRAAVRLFTPTGAHRR